MVKDVFGIAHIKLTGTNDAPLYLNAVDIVTISGDDVGSSLWIIHNGCDCFIHCKEKPEEVISLINELADKQEAEHTRIEEEAKAKAQESFFAKFPKAKEAYLEELKEQNKQ